jgi:hypothetical protein
MATAVATTEERKDQLPAVTPEGERFALRQRQAKMFAMSPLVPEHLRKGGAEQAIANCWIALTMAEAMGEQPLILMQNIHVVSGKAGFAAQYMIARANASSVFKGRIDWIIDKSDKDNLSVTAFAFLADTGDRIEFTVDMKMAKAEGWTKNPKYQSIPELMLRYRSATFLVRLYAPDVMLGYQTVEEVEDVVAAAGPASEPLTSAMLISQSQPSEPETDVVQTVEEPEVVEEDQRSEEDEQPAQVNDEAVAGANSEAQNITENITDEPHPAEAKCNEILDELAAANAIIDVNSITSRHKEDIEAMPDEMQIKIEVAADKRKNAIEAERAAASAAQKGELAV